MWCLWIYLQASQSVAASPEVVTQARGPVKQSIKNEYSKHNTEDTPTHTRTPTHITAMSIQSTTQKTPIVDKGLDAQTIKKL